MFGFGAGELIVIAIVLVLLFGSRKIPELAHGIGEAIKHLRGIFSEEEPGNRSGKGS